MQEAKANSLVDFLEAPKVLKDVDLAEKARLQGSSEYCFICILSLLCA